MVAEPFRHARQSSVAQKAGINTETGPQSLAHVEIHCAVQYISDRMNDLPVAMTVVGTSNFQPGNAMMTIYEDASRTGSNAVDSTLRSFTVVTKGLQQIATETSEFGKRSYEHQMTMFEKLLQAKSMDKTLELQNDFAKSIYQSWVSQATKLGEIYADMAREAYKPFEQAALGSYGRGVEYTRETTQAAAKPAKAAKAVDNQATA